MIRGRGMKKFLLVLGLATAGHCAYWHRKAQKQVNPQFWGPRLYLAPLQGFYASLGYLLPEPQRNYLRVAQPVAGVKVERIELSSAGVSLSSFLNLPAQRQSEGAVLFIHGGGHLLSSAGPAQTYASALARDLGVPVLNVEYRNAGEAPFPADLDDCYKALQWLQSSGQKYGFDPSLIAVCGQSAGGGLAASLAQRALDAGNPLNFQALIYPMLDDRTTDRSDRQGRGTYAWTPLDNKIAWNTYLGGQAGAPSLPAYAAPARRQNLAGLPPAWIGVGDQDLFYPEGWDYHQRLLQAGVESKFHQVQGMYHAADMIFPESQLIRDFYSSMLSALRASFEN